MRRLMSSFQVLVLLCIAVQPLSALGAEPAPRRSLSFIPRGWLGNVNGRNHSSVKDAFRPVVRAARKSTVRVLCDGEDIAFGTIVDASGFIITKHSELDGNIECVLGNRRRYSAQIAAHDADFDIALLKIGATDLTPIRWSSAMPQTGAWLATVGPRWELPTAIGFASAQPRRIPSPTAVLGVLLENSDQGPMVKKVEANSAAERCNLEARDIIHSVNGQLMQNAFALTRTIRGMRAGDRIEMEVLRAGRSITKKARLGDRAKLNNEQAGIMEDLAGPLSGRRAGFPLALQHDTVLKPKHCGGPLVDLSGHAVGINIARASRVASYAIPASAAQTLLAKLMAEQVSVE